MATGQEARFDNFATILGLKQFLIEKKRKLEREIEERQIPSNKFGMAKGYIGKIEKILATEYFNGSNYSKKVFQLMNRLKEDDVIFLVKIQELQRKIQDMEIYLQTSDEFIFPVDFAIPDEAEYYLQAVEMRRREYLWKIEAVRDELKRYEYRLDLCRALKGIICRPNGYFGAIYK